MRKRERERGGTRWEHEDGRERSRGEAGGAVAATATAVWFWSGLFWCRVTVEATKDRGGFLS